LPQSPIAVYLGKLIEMNEEEVVIDFWDEGIFEGEMSFKPKKSE
jgi:hypothetical protein